MMIAGIIRTLPNPADDAPAGLIDNRREPMIWPASITQSIF